jgi:3-oxoacyl-[acyl-carrier protein] reductase
MDLGLAGAKAIVTGGSKGIGRATAELLAQELCDVVIIARTQDLLESTAREIASATGQVVIPIAADMSQGDQAERAFDAAVSELGGIDIMVACAGRSPGGQLETLTEEHWMSSLNLKFMGHLRACRAVLPQMRQQGRGSIVLVVGNDGPKPTSWEITAGVANAADINLASALAEQYGRYGVHINTVNPGPVATERWDGLEKALARDKGISQADAHEIALGSLPFRRICEASEVANVVVFLASPRASYVNGAHVLVDGAQQKGLLELSHVADGFGAESPRPNGLQVPAEAKAK